MLAARKGICFLWLVIDTFSLTSIHKNKNGGLDTRDIHLPQILVDELKEYVDSLYGLDQDDYLFNLSKSSLHRELDRCIEETGIPDITVHGFRHSANALLSNVVKCPDVVRKYRLGHCDETTNDIYNHPYKYELQDVATKLNELMEDIDNVSEELGC